AEIRLDELARTGERRLHGRGHVRTRRRAVAHTHGRARAGELQLVPGHSVPVARELHPGGGDGAEAVVHRHGARCRRTHRKRFVRPGGIDGAAGLGPVVVTARLPRAVTAVHGAVELRPGLAVPEPEHEARGVDEVDLV